MEKHCYGCIGQSLIPAFNDTIMMMRSGITFNSNDDNRLDGRCQCKVDLDAILGLVKVSIDGIWLGDFKGTLLATFKRASAWNEYSLTIFLCTTLLRGQCSGQYVGEQHRCKVKLAFAFCKMQNYDLFYEFLFDF